MRKFKLSIAGIVLLVLLCIYLHSCNEKPLVLVNHQFTLLASSDQSEVFVNKSIPIVVGTKDFDNKNNDQIYTSITIREGEGSILLQSGYIKSAEAFLHPYKEENSFEFNYLPTKKGTHKIIVSAKSDIYTASDTIVFQVKNTETFYEFSDLPLEVYVNKEFTFKLNLLESTDENIKVNTKYVLGNGSITLGGKNINNTELIKGFNEFSVISEEIGDSEIEFTIKGLYGNQIKDTVRFKTLSSDWNYILPNKTNIELNKDYSFNIELKVSDKTIPNKFNTKIRYLNNVKGNLKVNGKNVTENDKFDLEKGNNVCIINPNVSGDFKVEFIVTDSYNAVKKDTLFFEVEEQINGIQLNVSPMSQSITINMPAQINIDISKTGYNDTFEFNYELVSGTGIFSGQNSQIISAGRHNYTFIPTQIGTNTLKFTVKDKQNQTTEQVTTVISVAEQQEPINMTVTPLSQNVSNGEPANILISISKAGYYDTFELEYFLISGNGNFSGSSSQIISSGSHKYSFTPLKSGTNTFRLKVKDNQNQIAEQVVTVISTNNDLSAEVNLNTFDIELNNEATYTLNVTEKNYSGDFKLSYISNGDIAGDFYVNSALLGPNLERKINSGSNKIRFVPSKRGKGYHTLKITDDRRQSKEINITVDTYLNINLIVSEGGVANGGGKIYTNKTMLWYMEDRYYKFDGWYDENKVLISKEDLYYYYPTKSCTIYAEFLKEKRKVTVTANEYGKASGGGDFDIESNVTIKATSINSARYKFSHWESGSQKITQQEYTFKLTSNKNFHAVFEQYCTPDIIRHGREGLLQKMYLIVVDNGYGFSKYQWYDANGSAIINETSNKFYPTKSGTYYCVCTTGRGAIYYTCDYKVNI